MTAQALHDFVYVGVFLLVAVLFAVSPIIASWLIGGRSVGVKRAETYESGMPAIGSAWIQFSVAYYIYALIFLAFDVDVLYLFPVALAYDKGYVIRDFIEIDNRHVLKFCHLVQVEITRHHLAIEMPS